MEPLNNEKTTKKEEIVPGNSDIQSFVENGFRAMINGVRNSNGIAPLFSNMPDNSTFNKIMDSESKRLLHIMTSVLNNQRIYENILQRDLEEKFELLIQANDMILDRVDSNLDEISGIRWNPPPEEQNEKYNQNKYKKNTINGSWNRNQLISVESKSNDSTIRLLAAKNIQRPQIKFKDKIDNRNLPFCPILKNKPNNLKPLAIFMETTDDGIEYYCHPYELELDRFSPSEEHLARVEIPRSYKPLSSTPLEMITEPHQIKPLVEELLKYKEIAVDLEHHSYRTYQGFTCLMQISTPDKDYIIDTLTLRNDLEYLNEVFTKPSIIKIFHGADQDIVWLQRDFGLYVIGLFDTHQASKTLEYERLSLAYLLKQFCFIDLNKHFQLADWRIRPLPDELITYAREDTHYLLHIYDILKNKLLDLGNGEPNILLSVFQKSSFICAKRYEKPTITETSYLDFYHKNKRLFNNRQLSALSDIFAWRDKLARFEDESTGYVLPNHMMLQIAESLPREVQGILACCNPIPPLLRQNVLTIHQMILNARDQPLAKPVVVDEVTNHLRPILAPSTTIDMESPLYCPHDLSHADEGRDDLPTVLNGLRIEEIPSHLCTHKLVDPEIDLFNQNIKEKMASSLKVQISLKSPYHRYKLTLKAAELEAEKQEKFDQKEMQKKKQEQVEREEANEQRLIDHIKLKEEQREQQSLRREIYLQKRKSKEEVQIIPPKIKKEDESNESRVKVVIQTEPNVNNKTTLTKNQKKKKNKNKEEKGSLPAFRGTNLFQNAQQKLTKKQRRLLNKLNKKGQSSSNMNQSNETYIEETNKSNNSQNEESKTIQNPNISNIKSPSIPQIFGNKRIFFETDSPSNSSQSSTPMGRFTPNKSFKRQNYQRENSAGYIPNDNQHQPTNFSTPKGKEENRPRIYPNESQNQQFQAFDYSEVDYNNFKGGSQKTPKNRNGPKEKFRQGKKRFQGKGNKGSSTFGLK